MRNAALSLCVLFFSISAHAQVKVESIAPAQPKMRLDSGSEATFARPKNEVWAALMETMTASDIHPESMDMASGVIFFKKEGAWTQAWGGTNEAVALLTTKKTGRMSSWQGFALSGNIQCKEVDAATTHVAAVFQFAGYNGFASWLNGNRAQWERLQSSGVLEKKLFEGVNSRLPDIVTRPGRTDLVESGARILESLGKVDAAYKIEADPQSISSALIEAQTRIDGLPEQWGFILPRFLAEVRACQASFVNARKEKNAEILAKARDSLGRARSLLESYRTVGRESIPEVPAIVVKPSQG